MEFIEEFLELSKGPPSAQTGKQRVPTRGLYVRRVYRGFQVLRNSSAICLSLGRIYEIYTKSRHMGARMVTSCICFGFLLGVIFSRLLFSQSDSLLTFEIYIFEIRFGLIFAAVFGITSCIIDGWYAWYMRPELLSNSPR
jgi:hypothetical protein